MTDHATYLAWHARYNQSVKGRARNLAYEARRRPGRVGWEPARNALHAYVPLDAEDLEQLEQLEQQRRAQDQAAGLRGHGAPMTREPCILCGDPILPDDGTVEVSDGEDGTLIVHVDCEEDFQGDV